MEVCDTCGRIIEEGHECSPSILQNQNELFNIIKQDRENEVVNHIEKLSLKPKDLLLFSYDPSLSKEEVENVLNTLNDIIKEHQERLVPFVVLPMTFDLQTMERDDLKAFIKSAQKLLDDTKEDEVREDGKV